MNDDIARIKRLEHQLKALRKIIEQEEYVGAGVSLNLCVGPRRDGYDDLELEVTEFLPDLLGVIDASLVRQIEYRRIYAKTDLRELQEFFAEEAYK